MIWFWNFANLSCKNLLVSQKFVFSFMLPELQYHSVYNLFSYSVKALQCECAIYLLTLWALETSYGVLCFMQNILAYATLVIILPLPIAVKTNYLSKNCFRVDLSLFGLVNCLIPNCNVSMSASMIRHMEPFTSHCIIGQIITELCEPWKMDQLISCMPFV